jgi:cbb3-type cytochrome oxidase subunit 3
MLLLTEAKLRRYVLSHAPLDRTSSIMCFFSSTPSKSFFFVTCLVFFFFFFLLIFFLLLHRTRKRMHTAGIPFPFHGEEEDGSSATTKITTQEAECN